MGEATSDQVLFPISVGNKAFKTAQAVAALDAIELPFDEIIVFVADRLQLYNKSGAVTDGTTFRAAMTSARPNHVLEREKWFRRVFQLSLAAKGGAKAKVIGVDDITDAAFFTIYRNIVVAFAAVPDFRRDVTANAAVYLRQHRQAWSDSVQRLSEGYILEDIALNLRLHLIGGLRREYYLGRYLPVLVALYGAQYGFSITSLCRDAVPGRHTLYAQSSRSTQGKWTEVLSVDITNNGTDVGTRLFVSDP